jgi:hypothetical protein
MLPSAGRPYIHLLLEAPIQKGCPDVELPESQSHMRCHRQEHTHCAIGADRGIRLGEVDPWPLLITLNHQARLVAPVALDFAHNVGRQRALADWQVTTTFFPCAKRTDGVDLGLVRRVPTFLLRYILG